MVGSPLLLSTTRVCEALAVRTRSTVVSVEQTLARAAKVNEKEGKCLALFGVVWHCVDHGIEHSLNIL